MHIQIVAIDFGYGYTKGLTAGKPPFICPSLVSPARDIRFSGGLGSANGITVRVDGFGFFVGQKAELQGRGSAQTLSSDRMNTGEILALFYAVASELVKVTTGEVAVITGLPVADFDKANQVKLASILRGEHFVERAGRKTRKFVVNKAVVIPQAVGAAYGLVLGKDGKITQGKEIQTGRVAVVDIGQLTTNFVTLDKLDYVDYLSTSQETGVSRLLIDLQRDLRDDFGLSLDKLSLVDKAVRAGFVTLRGEKQDISELIARHVRGLGDLVMPQAASLWGNGNDLSAVILTGGGAVLLADRMRETYPHVKVSTDSQFGNVTGYLRLATRKLGG